MSRASDWLDSFHSKSQKNKEQLSQGKFHQPIITSVTGGKGGVGKTSIAIKLAMELSRQHKVLLIDCDHNLSNTLIKLNIPINDNFYDLISSKKSFDEALYKSKRFHLLSGCNGNVEIFDRGSSLADFVLEIISSHGNDYEHIILDSPAGLGSSTVLLSAYAHARMIVVTPDKSSITDSYSLMKVLQNRFNINENFLVVNKVENSDQYRRVVKTLSETAENFLGCRTHILGYLQKYMGNIDRFDREFIFNKNSDLHFNFLKVLEAFVDKHSEGLGKVMGHCLVTGPYRFEHDVHPERQRSA